ncbi:hypothetical protein [Cohnella lupini]|uniref:Uncharacterized protein n=1 Tax=Cohnella lupini TaxID=1294267 RepID=A0A3D9HZD5_9BACL|nr:hypothetical protein [Cohnella lupini]RED54770.1 hypothetical protein DFP95_12126 [Cohnella lupini]
MQLTIQGKPIREYADMIIVKDGERTDSYNRKYYRETGEAGEPIALVKTKRLSLTIVTGLHGILAPVSLCRRAMNLSPTYFSEQP